MAILVDSNILLRSVQTHHPHYPLVERAFSILRSRNETLVVAVQNFVEFWAVATRPAGSENGLGMSTEGAEKELAILKDLFAVIPEPGGLFEEWERLVTTCRVLGKNTHDAHLAATMKLNGISRILTFNVQDFIRFDGIEAMHPATVGSSSQ
jgi:predicted nucleic acid-binding protein